MNINFHYYVVKTLAYYAGFGRSEEDQQKLAYYSQFVDDYYAGKHYPNGMLVHKNDILSELNYFISIGAVKETEDPDKLYFIPAFSGYTFMEAGYPSVQESTIIPFHNEKNI